MKINKKQLQVFPQQAALVAGDNGLPALYSDVSEVLWYLYKSLGHLAPQSTACTHTLQSMIYGCVRVLMKEKRQLTLIAGTTIFAYNLSVHEAQVSLLQPSTAPANLRLHMEMRTPTVIACGLFH